MYSLRKSTTILKQYYRLYKQKANILSGEACGDLSSTMMELQEAILNRDRDQAHHFSKELESLAKLHLKKNLFNQLRESLFALVFALVIAIFIRQMWFEFYEIPSGSMRPTFKENDRLVVSKAQFGLNKPLMLGHFHFNEENLKRMGIIIFTGENMDIPNVKTRYFYILPGYKQMIKRMIGLPGDTLYFYGGKIYGIDRAGNDISMELQPSLLKSLEHIPFIGLEGKLTADANGRTAGSSSIVIRQMNQPIAKLHFNRGEIEHELLVTPQAQTSPGDFDIYDLWGMKNYAQTRIVTSDLLKKEGLLPSYLPKSDYYLEITHHPSVKKATLGKDFYFRTRPLIGNEKSWIPLSAEHMRKIWDHLYTGRFVLNHNYLHRFGSHTQSDNSYSPKLKGDDIPNGTYEILDGKFYKVEWQGMTAELPAGHPLTEFNPLRCYTFYNAGIECDERFMPSTTHTSLLSSRYAYFRDGDLYLMGAPIFTKEDPYLSSFINHELSKESRDPSYKAFIDTGAPLKQDGTIDKELIRTYGIKVPDKHYLVLGDNHALSADSRDFGFVPQENLRGVPEFLFWAPAGRFGLPLQLAYTLFTPSRIAIWLAFLILFSAHTFINHRKARLPLTF